MIVTQAFVREAELQQAALGAAAIIPVVISHPLSTLTDQEIETRAVEALPQIERTLCGSLPRGV